MRDPISGPSCRLCIRRESPWPAPHSDGPVQQPDRTSPSQGELPAAIRSVPALPAALAQTPAHFSRPFPPSLRSRPSLRQIGLNRTASQRPHGPPPGPVSQTSEKPLQRKGPNCLQEREAARQCHLTDP